MTGVAQRVGRCIALLFHDHGTRRGWVVSSTPRPHFTTGNDPLPILQEVWWAPGLVWTGGKCRPHRESIPDRPTRSQSLYRLSYPAHKITNYNTVVLHLPPVFSTVTCYTGLWTRSDRLYHIAQWRTEGGGLGCSNPPPRNSEGLPKLWQTQPDLWKLLKNCWI